MQVAPALTTTASTYEIRGEKFQARLPFLGFGKTDWGGLWVLGQVDWELGLLWCLFAHIHQ